MSQTTSQSVYAADGSRYSFYAQMFCEKSDGTVEEDVALDNSNICEFEYVNELNQLYLTGSLTYVDRTAQIDRFIHKQFTFLRIQHIKHEKKSDNAFVVEELSETNRFCHLFLVDKIELLKRDTTIIKYKLHLISADIFKMQNHVDYSNFAESEEDLMDIMKTVFSRSQIDIDDETFDANKSGIKIMYATQLDDNCLTVAKYMLHKLYYYQHNLSDSLKFLVYDEHQRKFRIFDMSDTNTIVGGSDINLSMFKDNMEMMSQSMPNELATRTRIGSFQSFKNMSDVTTFDYDIETNAFVQSSIDSEKIVALKNNSMNSSGQYQQRYQQQQTTDFRYVKPLAYWNNNVDMYQELSEELLSRNSLIVYTNADILRKPAQVVNVNLGRSSMQFTRDEKLEELDDVAAKYRGFEGPWLVYRVRHIVSPQDQRYKQNVVLFRNYEVKPRTA